MLFHSIIHQSIAFCCKVLLAAAELHCSLNALLLIDHRGVADFTSNISIPPSTILMFLGDGIRWGMYDIGNNKLYWFAAFNSPKVRFQAPDYHIQYLCCCIYCEIWVLTWGLAASPKRPACHQETSPGPISWVFSGNKKLRECYTNWDADQEQHRGQVRLMCLIKIH